MLPRRTFLKNAGLLAAGVAALRPFARASARTVSPNEKLNVAVAGSGGVGASNISNCADGRNAAEICQIATAMGFACEENNNLEQALAKLANSASLPATVLICGSLYLAGEFLSKN